ncbi:hypothetical protein GCM10010387_11870 [Streptomyces inusitatus]|uniref:Uncharacterized protein n=1 Tax=Streptomyces inusitatus TaxID=68221 RepID=A0A918UMH5_9ACTN|nr:hypothetical protein GCM10010387_11870 [Streptomyces inusitatus]
MFAFARKIIPIRFMTPLMGFARPLLTDYSFSTPEPTVRALHPLPHCSGADALIPKDDCAVPLIRRKE